MDPINKNVYTHYLDIDNIESKNIHNKKNKNTINTKILI